MLSSKGKINYSVFSLKMCESTLRIHKNREQFLKKKYPFIEKQFYLTQTQFNFKNEFQNVNRNGSA